VKARLRALADRYTGAKAVHLREQPVPWAYRVFARQVGMDPDAERIPVERVAVDRLKHGGFRSRGVVDDALTLAIGDTGVAVMAFDADEIAGELGLRLARAGERLGPVVPTRERQIVVADAERPVALALRDVAEDAAVTGRTQRVVVAALQVKDVPRLAVEEALHVATGVLLYS
jgi:DNA/RNA-binding domain of Phe-tRNA-synthetase-like protein